MKLTRNQIHEQVYFYGLILLAVSLPLSIFTVTLSQTLLLLNWLVEGRFREKWQRFKQNPAIGIFLALYLLHAIGLLWSTDPAYSSLDMRVKASMFFLPLIIGTSVPLRGRKVDIILLFFTLAVFAASMASVMALLGKLSLKR